MAPHSTSIREPSGSELRPGIYRELETLTWIGSNGVEVVRHKFVSTVEEAVVTADEFGYPVVMKVVSSNVLHKSEFGGVCTSVAHPLGVREAFELLVDSHQQSFDGANPTGVLVEPQLDGLEVLVGVKRDPSLGAFVMFGFGGVLAELVADTAVALAPFTADEANTLIDATRVARLVDGYRGREPVNRRALVKLLVAVSELAAAHPELAELDLNPVIVGPRGAIPVDARMVVTAPVTLRGSSSREPLPLTLFEPRSIAVVGASRDSQKPGGRVLRYLLRHGYSGRIYPVNTSTNQVQGLPTVGSLRELAPGSVDLACVAVPADRVIAVLRECAAAKIPAAILYSAGFGEAGALGIKLEEDLLGAIAGNGTRVRCVGPNSNGVVSTGAAVFASIGMALEIDPTAPGPVALITQSGAVGSSLLSRGWDEGLNFSRWVSTGNEVDISLGEYVEFLASDPCTTVILLFIEGIRDGDRFAGAVGRCLDAGKPVVAYKAGSSVAGRKAVSSHTGALAGDDSLYDAYFRTVGVTRVSSLRGLLDAGRILRRYSLPRGNRVGLITMSGGAAAILSDECATSGLSVPELPLSVQEQLTAVMPGFGTVGNPLDVTAEAITDPSVILKCLHAIVACHEIDMVAVQLTTNADPSALAIAEGIVSVIQRTAKPVLVGRLGSPRLAPLAMQHYRESDVPVFDSPEALIAAARVLATCGDVISRMSTAEDTP